MDEGRKQTDKLLSEMEKKIAKEYKQAEKEIEEKLNDYLERFAVKDEQKRRAVKSGKITQKEYNDWRKGQIMIGQRWTEMKNTLAEDYHNANLIARSTIYGYMPEVYALNHNYGTFEVESQSQIDTSYTLYDRQTVERLMRDNPDLLPPVGKKLAQRIAAGQDVLWNKQLIQSVMTQSILQGESIDKIAKRLSKQVGDTNKAASIRNARTMTTSAENAGRVNSYKRAQDMGINLRQQWIAALDGRTRDSHRQMDGETIPVGGIFSNGLRFPADPEGRPEEVWNCRCTLVAQLKGFQTDASNLGLRNVNKLGNMSYDEWKNEHQKTDKQKVAGIKSGNASGIVDGYEDIVNDYAQRFQQKDIDKFNEIFSVARFAESNNGCEFDPDTNTIFLDKNTLQEDTMFHESTHWYDYNQSYDITEDRGYYKWLTDSEGNLTGEKEWVPKMVTIQKNAGFSQYIGYIYGNYDEQFTSMSARDRLNCEKIIGLSGKYGYDKDFSDSARDMRAITDYLKKKGMYPSDPDYGHLSDFISAMTYDSNMGSVITGGHDFEYWTYGEEYRVTEITAGYNILKCLGRYDIIEIEKELAPELMEFIEREWSKIW